MVTVSLNIVCTVNVLDSENICFEKNDLWSYPELAFWTSVWSFLKMHIFYLQEETIILGPGQHCMIVQSLCFFWQLNPSHKHECIFPSVISKSHKIEGFQLCGDNRKRSNWGGSVWKNGIYYVARLLLLLYLVLFRLY